MAMYHMAMQPQYGGTHPPPIHSSIFPDPLLPPGNHSHSLHDYSSQQNGGPYFSETNQTSGLNTGMAFSQNSCFSHHPTVYVDPAVRNSHQDMVSSISGGHQHVTPSQSHNICYSTTPANTVFHSGHLGTNEIGNKASHFGSSQRHQVTVDEELLKEMNTLHLGYLETEDSPHKMEQREKLENVIMEYLSITAHNRKFMFHHVRDVLEKSIMMMPDFSAHDAACAFDALAQYAANLVSQPWRKEFREIKLHNGFWVHQVSSHLFSAESILELMGYVRKSSRNKISTPPDAFHSHLRNVSDFYILQGVIDPDLIARLALDCMIAYCECQCLKKLKDGVKEYDLSWAQILQFRQIYIGGMDVSLRHLLFTLRQYSSPTKTLSSPDTIQTSTPLIPPISNPHTSSYTSNHSKVAAPTGPDPHLSSGLKFDHREAVNWSQSKSSNDLKGHNQLNLTLGSGSSSQRSNALRDNFTEDKIDGCRSSNCGSGKSGTSVRVPTARLIDLDSSFENVSHHKSNHHHLLPKVLPHNKSSSKNSSLRKSNRCSLPNQDSIVVPQPLHPPPEAFQQGTLDEHLEATLNLVKNPNRTHSGNAFKESDNDTLEAWDFVFRGLEKKGYNKDIGDRGDILQGNTFHKKSHSENVSNASGRNVNYALNNAHQDVTKNKPLTINQALHQLSLQDTKERMDKPSSSRSSHSISHSYIHENRNRNSLYDNLSATGFETANQDSIDSEEKRSLSLLKKVNNVLRCDIPSKIDNLTINKNSEASSSTKSGDLVSNKTKDHTSSKPGPRESKERKWACITCTYENKIDLTICEMCGKSKDPGPETKPLESGGKQCPLCTLINDRNAETCSACGVDLKGSSTYI